MVKMAGFVLYFTHLHNEESAHTLVAETLKFAAFEEIKVVGVQVPRAYAALIWQELCPMKRSHDGCTYVCVRLCVCASVRLCVCLCACVC